MSDVSLALVPYYGPGAHQHYESIRRAKLTKGEIIACGVDVARSLLIQMALSTKAEVFVFIDSDVSFVREDYDLIVQSCLETKAIVGAPYLTKSMSGDQRMVGSYKPPVEQVLFYEQGGRYPAIQLGMGFTALHRSAVEQVIEGSKLERVLFEFPPMVVDAYPLFMPIIREGRYLLDDFAFSIRALEAGVDLFLDTRPRGIRHHGSHPFRLEDMGHVSAHDPGLSLRSAHK